MRIFPAMPRRTPLAILLAAAAGAMLWTVPQPGSAQPPANASSATASGDPSQLVETYCTGCHNERAQVAGLVLNPADAATPGPHADIWEKVLHKLKTEDMPPPGMPRPASATYQSAAAVLEARLDLAAEEHPNPGELPLLHRLTRTEYRNTIRDLLGIYNLPREMDYQLLLPPDNTASGFDNLAELLFVSPAIMERYLDAARKIARLAIGDPRMQPMVNIYAMIPEYPQQARVEELPFGTRGGMAIHSYFPLDANYQILVETTGAGREPHELEVSVDGEPVERVTVLRGSNDRPEVEVPIPAGPHMLGVTFIKRSDAGDERTVRPNTRGRGTVPGVAQVTVRGPFEPTGVGATPAREKIYVCQPKTAAEETPCAREIFANLARRAFRRPVEDADLDRMMAFYDEGYQEAGFDAGIQRGLERLLVSPSFLFRIEREPAGAAPGTSFEISALELASRLSFFIWSSIPDDELLDIAIDGHLHEPEVLSAQVRRMLADERSKALVDNFAAQWLMLPDLPDRHPDHLIFRDYDQSLVTAFRRETELFLDSILRSDRSVLDLIDADYTFVNERLAEHYGIPNIVGARFRRVTFPEGDPRGGLLGQGSILTITSYPTRTSPVLRGKYVLENLLASPPPPPPPNVPALDTKGEAPGESLTMRAAMELHRKNPPCSGCHARMDPIGFALENFDAVGRYREKDGGKEIDASGVLPDGTSFTGSDGLKQILLADPERFVNAVTEKLMMFATGRNVQYYDRPAIRQIVRDAAANDYRFADLVEGVAKSIPFRMRKVSDAPAAATDGE